MQRQSHKVAQIVSLSVPTKLPWEQGKEKHWEQKGLVSLLPFKSPVRHAPCKDRRRRRLFSRTELLYWEKPQRCSSAATREQPDLHHRPRASATTVSLRFASESCGCRRGRPSVTSPTPAANQHQLPVCAFLAQRSAMGSAAEGYAGVTERYDQPGIIYVL